MRPRASQLAKLEARAPEAEALALKAEIEAAKLPPEETARLAREAADAAAAEIEIQRSQALEVVLRENPTAAGLNAETAAALNRFIDAHEAAQTHAETVLQPAFRRARGLECEGLPLMATPEVPGRKMPRDPVKFNEMINAAVALIRRVQW
jgi:ATP/maltotriose-dependent transcriptional regulator MalT